MARVWHATMGLKPRLTPTYVALALMAGGASAQPVAGPAVEVFANSLGRPHEGTVVIPAEMLVGTDGVYSWELSQPLEILSRSDGLTVVGTIDTLSVSFENFENNPAVELSFGVSAEDNNTTFFIKTGDLLFPGIRFPEAFADVNMTVRDNDNNGARVDTFTGMFSPGLPGLPGGLFLQEDLIAPPGGFAGLSERRPSDGRLLLPEAVFGMTSLFLFDLSANDSVIATSRVDVVPEPTAISFLAVGGIALWRLRRRRP